MDAYKYKRTVTLILQSNQLQELNKLAYSLFDTKSVNAKDINKAVVVNATVM